MLFEEEEGVKIRDTVSLIVRMHAIISYKAIASEFKSLHFYINMLKKDENEYNIIIHVNFHLLLTGNNKIFFYFLTGF